MKYKIFTSLFLYLLIGIFFLSYKSDVHAACVTGNQTSATISSSCGTVAATIEGVDNGSGTTNTGTITITSGATVTLNANSTLVAGTVTLTNGSIAISGSGASLKLQPIWMIDGDADGISGSTTQTVQFDKPSNASRRRNLLTDLSGNDCDDNNASITFSSPPQLDNNSGVTGSTTFSFTVGNNSGRVLIVSIATIDTNSDITNVTFNGTGLTQAGEIVATGSDPTRAELWYLNNPTVTTANIVITANNVPNGIVAVASSYYNVTTINSGSTVTAASSNSCGSTFITASPGGTTGKSTAVDALSFCTTGVCNATCGTGEGTVSVNRSGQVELGNVDFGNVSGAASYNNSTPILEWNLNDGGRSYARVAMSLSCN